MLASFIRSTKPLKVARTNRVLPKSYCATSKWFIAAVSFGDKRLGSSSNKEEAVMSEQALPKPPVVPSDLQSAGGTLERLYRLAVVILCGFLMIGAVIVAF
jgi:hypothetical protein